jgi:hypothetical protein
MSLGSNASPSSSSALRWLLKFTLFLLFFAALTLALMYAWQTMREHDKPAVSPPMSPTPTVAPTTPVSGASGHAERQATPRP